jgi:hypothetical protein
MSRRARENLPTFIPKIVELAIDWNLDSWYYVIRNRIGYPKVTKILFLVAIYESSHELKNLGVKTVYLVISHPIERHGSHICKSSR